jgi:hypothetical protein
MKLSNQINTARQFKALLNPKDGSDFALAIDKAPAIERICIALCDHISVLVTSENGNYYVVDIINRAIQAFFNADSDFDVRYKSFLYSVVNDLPYIMQFSISNANDVGPSDPACYWDCLSERYVDWVARLNVISPLVEPLSNNTKWIENQRDIVGLLLAGQVFKRSDWSFLGVPQPGKTTIFRNTNKANNLETII